MLQEINRFFGSIGKIRQIKSYGVYELKFQGVKICLIIKNKFYLYPLMTYKVVFFNME
jgi:hypothetical protein